MNNTITIYELLGLVKDGNAPKKIRAYENFWVWNKEQEEYIQENKGSKMFGLFCDFLEGTILDSLNDTVEILEEEKKIPEKIVINENGTIGFPNGQWIARNMDKAFAMKINSIIDYLKSKGDE